MMERERIGMAWLMPRLGDMGHGPLTKSLWSKIAEARELLETHGFVVLTPSDTRHLAVDFSLASMDVSNMTEDQLLRHVHEQQVLTLAEELTRSDAVTSSYHDDLESDRRVIRTKLVLLPGAMIDRVMAKLNQNRKMTDV